MTKHEKLTQMVRNILDEVRILGDEYTNFEINLDDDGGYIEIENTTFGVSSEMKINETSIVI